jgi:ATP-dependent protease ClpP protease subunit
MPKIEQAEIDWLLEHQPSTGVEVTDWYKIDAKGKRSKSATVWIMDEITPWGSGARKFSEEVASLDVDTIELHLNSPGGNFAEGIAIMNMLRDHKATVTAQIDGLAASAATIVAMGADQIVAKAGSQMMIHEGSGLVYGPMADMLKMAQVLEKTNAQMAEIYADRAGGTPAEWRAAMAEETWYTAAEAVDAGLADTLDASGKEQDVVAACKRFDLTVFAHAGRDKAPDPYKPTAGPPDSHNEEDEEMPNKILVQMATDLGVEGVDKLDTDEKLSEAIKAAQAAAVKAAADAKVSDTETKPDDDPKPDGGAKTPSVKIPDGFAMVDKSTLEALQASARRSDSVIAKMEEKERDAALDAAVAKGKIPNARRDAWVTMWTADPEGAKAALAAIPDNLVPVNPIGQGGTGEYGEVDADYARLYPEESGLNG